MLHRAFVLYLTVVGMMMISSSEARGLANLLVRIDLERRASLAARQTGGGTAVPQPPSQCQSVCNPVDAVLNANCTPSSCCNENFEYSFFGCYQCVGGVLGLTDYTSAQTVLDEVINECAAIGINLPKLTFPGQNLDRTLSSTAVPSISQATVSQVTVAPATITSPPYQSTVGPSTLATLSTSATSSRAQSTPVSSLGVRSAQSGMLGFLLVVTMMALVEFFYLG